MLHIIDEKEPMIRGMVKHTPITERFILTQEEEKQIRDTGYKFGFGGLSDTVYYRTYSQLNNINKKENFPDTIIRVIQGVMSIRKNWYIIHGIYWDETYWKQIALRMGEACMKLQMLPPGRGLWICGTKYMYEKGAASLNNCGFTSTEKDLVRAVVWLCDNLMSGCGIGFDNLWKYEIGKLNLPGCKDCRFQWKCEEKNGKAQSPYFIKPSCHCSILTYVVHDSREGWVKSLQLLMDSYVIANSRTIHFDYSAIREKGAPIKGFGGISSGYISLEILHNEIRSFIECFFESKKIGIIQATINMCVRRKEVNCIPKIEQIGRIHQFLRAQENNKKKIKKQKPTELNEKDMKFLQEQKPSEQTLLSFTKTYNEARLITDICNAIGVCIISANVRRSAEISLGRPDDIEFLNLKNYKLNPERASIGWMSNNTVTMKTTEEFQYLPAIGERIKDNGEPGILNLINVERYGRIKHYFKKNICGREKEIDKAIGINPCGEIPLESEEMCCLVDLFSNRCSNYEELANAAELATIYASTISLYTTHWAGTNAVVGRNHRIGVSFCSIADYHDKHGFTQLTSDLKNLYKIVRNTNQILALEACVRESIRVTTIKPNGSTSLLVGGSPGAHFPCFKYSIRRVRIASDSDLVPILQKAGYTYEIDVYSGPQTLVFSFPIDQTFGGTTRPATDISLREQSMLQQSLARIWADNSVSQTLYFNPETESKDIENVLAQTTPMVKSLSMLPHVPKGVYPQSPFEEITESVYLKMVSQITDVDWEQFTDSPIMTRGCDGDACEMMAFKNHVK